jgi:hypothetical protein
MFLHPDITHGGMSMTTIYEWLQNHNFAGFDTRRSPKGTELARTIHRTFVIQSGPGPTDFVCQAEKFRGRYEVAWFLKVQDGATFVTPNCTCPDWTERGRLNDMPCKHLLAVAMRSEEVPEAIANSTPSKGQAPEPVKSPADDSLSFGERVSQAISKAIADLSKQVQAVLLEGYVPLLLGPTGCGKTSAMRHAALQLGARLVEHSGADSWSDSDLVGLEMPSGKRFPGPVANALTYAREMGEPVLLFFDEFLRNNPRAQESLMRLLLPISSDVVAAMGLPQGGAIRATSAPFWGEEWAPAELVHVALAGNPWGNVPDPALIRRTVPLMIDFDAGVANLFDKSLKNAIELSWSGTRDGSLPLPIEYGELARARNVDDQAVMARYLNRLHAIDPAAAGGFETLLKSTNGSAK